MNNDTLLSALAGGLQGWSVAFWGDENAAQTALVGVDARRRHLWLAVWAQMSLRAERVDAPDDFDLWRARLRDNRARDIAAKAGFGGSVGLLRALGRLPWRGLVDAQTYCRLGDLLESGGPGRKLINHAATLSQDTIDVVDVLPDDLRERSLLDNLTTQGDLKRHVAERLAWRLARYRELYPETAEAFVAKLLSGETDPDELLHHLSFPPPPWEGDDALKPLDTPDRMRDAGKRFRNCLGSRMNIVYAGQTYFYELDGRAVVELDHISGLGWEVFDVRGPKNADVDDSLREELRRRLDRAPTAISHVLPAQT